MAEWAALTEIKTWKCYPDRAEFIGLDLEHAGQMAWETLKEGRDVILVDGAGAELWFHIARTSWLRRVSDRLLRRVGVFVYERGKPEPSGQPATPVIYTHVRSHSLIETIPRRWAPTAEPVA